MKNSSLHSFFNVPSDAASGAKLLLADSKASGQKIHTVLISSKKTVDAVLNAIDDIVDVHHECQGAQKAALDFTDRSHMKSSI